MTYSDHFCTDIVDKIYDMIYAGDKRTFDVIERELMKEEIDRLYDIVREIK